MLILHTKTIHTSTANNSDNCRWATIFRFDNAQDSKFYDMHNNPLHEGYIMVDDKSERSGFKPAGKKLVF